MDLLRNMHDPKPHNAMRPEVVSEVKYLLSDFRGMGQVGKSFWKGWAKRAHNRMMRKVHKQEIAEGLYEYEEEVLAEAALDLEQWADLMDSLYDEEERERTNYRFYLDATDPDYADDGFDYDDGDYLDLLYREAV